jgi:dTDP-4-dehydrorhamnose reductase
MLSSILSKRCATIATYCAHPFLPDGVQGLRVDLSEQGAIERHIIQHGPQVIVHLAAITNPDRCEENPEVTRRINLEATSEIADIANRIGARLIFASTDLVFDGTHGSYTEDDPARPLSVYGTSKIKAEEAVLEKCADGMVFRSSLIYGRGSPASRTFLSTVLDRFGRGEKMRLFTDQKRNPILVDDLARAIIAAIECDISGRYHIAGPDVVTRSEFGQMVCRVFGYDEDLVVPIAMQDFDYRARRPLDSTLNTAKFVGATGFMPASILEGLMKIRAEM